MKEIFRMRLMILYLSIMIFFLAMAGVILNEILVTQRDMHLRIDDCNQIIMELQSEGSAWMDD